MVTVSSKNPFEITKLKMIDLGQARTATAMSTEKTFAGGLAQLGVLLETCIFPGESFVVDTAAHQIPSAGQWPYEALVSQLRLCCAS